MDLMQELRQKAQALEKVQADHKAQREAQREENRVAVEAAMHRAFKYFHELLKHLDIVKPTNPTSYIVPHVGAFGELSFKESFIDFRKKREADVEIYDKVHFYIRWASEVDMKVDGMSPQHVQRVRDALWTCNIRYSEDEARSGPAGPRTVFTIPRHIVTDVEVRAIHVEGIVLFSTRNLARLGPEDFKVPAGEASKEVFDDLGRMLLGQRSNFGRYRVFLAPGQK